MGGVALGKTLNFFDLLESRFCATDPIIALTTGSLIAQRFIKGQVVSLRFFAFPFRERQRSFKVSL